MKCKTFAICDEEEDFAYSLMAYFNETGNLLFRAQAYTSIEVLKAYLEHNKIELLVVCASYLGMFETKNVDCILVLSEGEAGEENVPYPYLYKFQAAKRLIQEAMMIYSEAQGDPLNQIKNKTEIIGIYSPLSRIGKTKFSLTLGQVLAQKKKTLLLNLEDYGGFTHLLKQDYQKDLSDLIYYYRQKTRNFGIRMEEIIKHYQDLSYIPPLQRAADLWDITKEDMIGMLEEIVKGSRYEVILIDFGNGISGLFDLLAMCKTIYTPVLEDNIARIKVQEFESQLAFRAGQKTEFNLVKLTLPEVPCQKNREFKAEEMIWGELGDVVRKLGY